MASCLGRPNDVANDASLLPTNIALSLYVAAMSAVEGTRSQITATLICPCVLFIFDHGKSERIMA